jgi:general secretion pathway protein G
MTCAAGANRAVCAARLDRPKGQTDLCCMPHCAIHLRRAFTLLEVMIVVVILGILAAIVVPQFSSATDDAKASALRSGLAGVRASIAGYRANAILAGTDPYPTLALLTAEGTVLQGGLPENPYNKRTSVQAVTRAQADARAVINEGTVGWNYFADNAGTPPVAIFYANSDDSAGKDASNNDIAANDY